MCSAMRATPAAVLQRDDYEFWLALLLSRTTRRLVVVDPPYQQTDERARIVGDLAGTMRTSAHRVTVI